MSTVAFFVPGVPVQQGSKRSLGPGRPFIEANKERLVPWRESVAWHARENRTADADDGVVFAGPVQVELVASFPRPKSHYRGKARVLRDDAPLYKTSTPDIDKIARAALDALTVAAMWRDDSQVAHLATVKVYSERPGLGVVVTELVPA